MTVYQNPDSFFNAVEDAVDTAFSEFVQSTQGLLTSRAPVDTGRLASSFFISKTFPSDEVRSLPWAPKGAKVVERPEYRGLGSGAGNKITYGGTWFITNNVPYGPYVAFDPVYGKGGRAFGPDWYTATVNQNPARFQALLRKNLRGV